MSRADEKRPDGATLVPWTCGKPLAREVTVPDTYAASHLPSTSVSACAAAKKSAANKTTKYATITCSFPSLLRQAVPGAPSQRNSLRISAGESPSSLTSRWRQRISFRGYHWQYREITDEPLETTYLFQMISLTLQRGTLITDEPLETTYLFQRISVTLQRGNAVAFRVVIFTQSGPPLLLHTFN